jgi:hypothetical protein
MNGRANPEAVIDILTKLSPHREGNELKVIHYLQKEPQNE